ncbi:MAG: hypothetical protein II817_12790 [Bacteroidales bacterium]|nr:hypothetical protein [Bacteroidales bacterium]
MSDAPSRSVIHKWAAASAVTAAVLPVGVDAAALFGEECLMVVQVAAMFGHNISKKTAEQAIVTGLFGTVVGYTVFEGLDVGYPLTIPAKIGVATAVMEALGNATYELYKSGKSL